MRVLTGYFTVILGSALAAWSAVPAESKGSGPRKVARLECAAANASVETGTAGGTYYCQTIANECNSPVALTIVDDVTHVSTGTGQVDVQQSGKICTSHPNAVEHYYVYESGGDVEASKGKGPSSWTGVTVKSWTCSHPSVIGSDGSFQYSSLSGMVMLRVNGFAQSSISPTGQSQSTSIAEILSNALVITEKHQQEDEQDGVFLREIHRTTISRSGSMCSCRYTSDRTWKHGNPQHFSGGDTYQCEGHVLRSGTRGERLTLNTRRIRAGGLARLSARPFAASGQDPSGCTGRASLP